MNRRTSSTLAFSFSAAAAAMAATLMAGNALADDITVDTSPFFSQRSRAEVQAEMFSYRDSTRNYSAELGYSEPQPQQVASSYSREQARAEYIAARDEVHALTAEDSGSAMLAQIRAQQRASFAMAQSSR